MVHCTAMLITIQGSIYKNHKDTKVIPYNTWRGCIIAGPDDRFFSSQVGGSMSGAGHLASQHEIQIKDSVDFRIFYDRSLLTLRPHRWKKRDEIIEYPINWHQTPPHHQLHQKSMKVCELHSKANEASRFRAIASNDALDILVYHTNGTAELVRFTPT